MDAMLTARGAVEGTLPLHKLVVQFVARNELCWRFMAIPGVGLTACFGLTLPWQ